MPTRKKAAKKAARKPRTKKIPIGEFADPEKIVANKTATDEAQDVFDEIMLLLDKLPSKERNQVLAEVIRVRRTNNAIAVQQAKAEHEAFEHLFSTEFEVPTADEIAGALEHPLPEHAPEENHAANKYE